MNSLKEGKAKDPKGGKEKGDRTNRGRVMVGKNRNGLSPKRRKPKKESKWQSYPMAGCKGGGGGGEKS